MNFSTGPINISKEVQTALVAPSISHRSTAFINLYKNTTNFLCDQFNTKSVSFITGSGTAANEAMIWQIKKHVGKGLILSNGEFGLRLIEQAKRASLQFIEHSLSFGAGFKNGDIEAAIRNNNIKWLLFCHCETSTGVVNNLEAVADICLRNNCLCFVDCMSTVGTCALDLSCISMATASSGKGLASIAGIGIVFSNIEVVSCANTPLYLDLGYHAHKDGIPFTISSNLINALYVSAEQKLQKEQFKLIDSYSAECFKILAGNKMLPFDNEQSKVFTISTSDATRNLPQELYKSGIVISYESNYLKKRALCQLAFFGYYQEKELDKLLLALKKTTSVLIPQM